MALNPLKSDKSAKMEMPKIRKTTIKKTKTMTRPLTIPKEFNLSVPSRIHTMDTRRSRVEASIPFEVEIIRIFSMESKRNTLNYRKRLSSKRPPTSSQFPNHLISARRSELSAIKSNPLLLNLPLCLLPKNSKKTQSRSPPASRPACPP